MLVLSLIVLGLIAGTLAGMIGIGGGIIIVPALVYLFHFTQKTAQGTMLALLAVPIGIFAAWAYYKAGNVDLKAAAFIIIGFLVGSYLSAHYATGISDKNLSRIFGLILLIVAVKMLATGK